jgi:large subunit ribosomal protein L21
MYAIVKTGGKQYRVEQGSSLLVERLRADEGAKVSLEPLLYVDGSKVLDGGDGVKVEAKVLAHERGPKLRIVKFKPKRGYKRRTGHRQELTRLEVTSIKGPAARAPRASASAAAAKDDAPAKPRARRPAAPKGDAPARPRTRRAAPKPKEADDGS